MSPWAREYTWFPVGGHTLLREVTGRLGGLALLECATGVRLDGLWPHPLPAPFLCFLCVGKDPPVPCHFVPAILDAKPLGRVTVNQTKTKNPFFLR